MLFTKVATKYNYYYIFFIDLLDPIINQYYNVIDFATHFKVVCLHAEVLKLYYTLHMSSTAAQLILMLSS